jgi:PAS domain S-box-containing protein
LSSSERFGSDTHAAGAALHLAAIVASSDDVIISQDLDGIVRSWNPAAERLLGYSGEEMIGHSIRKIRSFQPTGRRKKTKCFARCVRRGR